tara:strand:+ start:8527 stop:8715 length:189 start_codon:yes stop_codon:yes gene_type:complete
MEIIGMKKKVSFTIDEKLMEWFRNYASEESTTMSAVLNQHILKLKRRFEKPKNILSSQKKHY